MQVLFRPKIFFQLLMITLMITTQRIAAQDMLVNTALLEGLDITPDNILGFQIQSMSPQSIRCRIDGTITFRSTKHSIKYNFLYTVKPGLNVFDQAAVNLDWNFSSSALRELFMYHKLLPQGTYQYCVSITPNYTPSESVSAGSVDDCIYKQSKDLFSITLLEPENNAKLQEYNPMLTWVATYPFLNELTYRIRIAEIKDGQNPENAIARNNPIYSENNLTPSSIIYPVYAKPLQAWQPYAWTVDAYYKGILLGGAQPWKFTIIEDSLLKAATDQSSFIDVNMDEGDNRYYAVGQVKLKYSENDYLQNEVKVSFFRKGKEMGKAEILWQVKRGPNFITHDVSGFNLKHHQEFEVVIEPKDTRFTQFKKTIKYKYVNPNFVK